MSDVETCWEDLGSRWQLSLRLDGEAVSGLGVVKKRMRIGSAVVRMGGIAGVWTAKQHRLKGYASRGMWASVALMEEQGYEMSLLFGIPDFYHRFGYAVVLPDPLLHVKTGDLLRASLRHPIRPARRADGPQIARLYNRCNALRTGTTLRPREWAFFERSPGFKKPGRAIFALDGKGRMAGYALYSTLGKDGQDLLGALKGTERFRVSEIAARDGSAFETLAAAVGRQARRAKAEEVDFYLPPDDPFGEFCARLGCRWSINYPRNRSSMGRIVRLVPLMEALLPELTRRIRTTRPPWKGVLRVQTDIGTVNLDLNGQSVRLASPAQRGVVVRIPQIPLTQLIMGYRSVSDVALDPGVTIPARALPVLSALFPKGHPYMWWSDRF